MQTNGNGTLPQCGMVDPIGRSKRTSNSSWLLGTGQTTTHGPSASPPDWFTSKESPATYDTPFFRLVPSPPVSVSISNSTIIVEQCNSNLTIRLTTVVGYQSTGTNLWQAVRDWDGK